MTGGQVSGRVSMVGVANSAPRLISYNRWPKLYTSRLNTELLAALNINNNHNHHILPNMLKVFYRFFL